MVVYDRFFGFKDQHIRGAVIPVHSPGDGSDNHCKFMRSDPRVS